MRFGTPPKKRTPDDGHQHPLLRFTRIGNDEHLSTIAQTKMGDLDGLLHPADDSRFVTPIKLTGLAGWKS